MTLDIYGSERNHSKWAGSFQKLKLHKRSALLHLLFLSITCLWVTSRLEWWPLIYSLQTRMSLSGCQELFSTNNIRLFISLIYHQHLNWLFVFNLILSLLKMLCFLRFLFNTLDCLKKCKLILVNYNSFD